MLQLRRNSLLRQVTGSDRLVSAPAKTATDVKILLAHSHFHAVATGAEVCRIPIHL